MALTYRPVVPPSPEARYIAARIRNGRRAARLAAARRTRAALEASLQGTGVVLW